MTLIETFAFMTDQLLYRLNRVPDRLHVKFLDLIGLRLLPPTPARTEVTFWLSTPALATLTIARGTEVGTVRTQDDESIVFSTVDELTAVACALTSVRTRGPGQESTERTPELRSGLSFAAFGQPPDIGDELLVGLNSAVPGCAVRLDVVAGVDGVGVNPDHVPLVWEAWTGQDWHECAVSTDETGGLNRSGAIVVHVPARPPGERARRGAGRLAAGQNRGAGDRGSQATRPRRW